MTKARLLIGAAFAFAFMALPGVAAAKDRNHDKIPDSWEKAHHLSTEHNVAKKDPDKDGLTNRQEFVHGTDPRDADSDNDGLEDGTEVEVGDNPDDADTDDDGIEDGGETNGTVQHFDADTGVLTIVLSDGTTTRSGVVSADTRTKCDGHSNGLRAASHGADDVQQGSDDGTDGHGPEGHGRRVQCTTADLTDGRVVHEVKLVSDGNGGFVFRKVELDG